MGTVYLICDPADDLFKIGVTKTEHSKRLKLLLTGNGNGIFLVNTYKCEYPYRLESILHRRFAYCKETGEWYRLKVEDVVNFKQICEQIDNTIHLLKDNEFFVGNGLK